MGAARSVLGLEKRAVLAAWSETIFASGRVVVCSRDLVTTVANVQGWQRTSSSSVFIGVFDEVFVEVLDAWQVYSDILVKDLTKGYQLGLSAVGTSA